MNDKKAYIIVTILGAIIVIWCALLVAPYIDGGLAEIIRNLPEKINNPFDIEFSKGSIKTVLIFLLSYFMGIGVYLSTKRNYRKGKEYGSATWGQARQIAKKYKQKPSENNKILTKNVAIGLNAREHKKNLNTLIIGGSGAGKTRFYAKPNIMQCNTSYVVLDPKGEILRDTGNLLEQKGYKIKVLDLKHPKLSHCYNPFVYVRNDADVQKLITNLFKAIDKKKGQSASTDPYWDISASMLLSALVFYLKYEAPEEEQNFAMITEMIKVAKPREDEEDYESPLDILFKRLASKNPNHIAVKYYKDFRVGAGKTMKSIISTLNSKIEKFNLDSITRNNKY